MKHLKNSSRARVHVQFSRGFTLIELMIVVAIIGILSAIAYPSYAEHVKRGRRADVQKALLEAAQYMQRYYAGHNTYVASSTSTSQSQVALPSPLNQSPQQGTKAYDIAVSASTARSFTLTATPTTGGPMDGDRCGNFTLTSLNERGVSSSTVAQCWK